MKITVEALVESDIDAVWNAWTSPEDIKLWNTASDDWHTTQASVDLREGGSFSYRMEAKDGSAGFDFTGTFQKIVDKQLIEWSLGDGRSVAVRFSRKPDGVSVEETFETESENDAEQQRVGWQAILNNFAKHVEAKKRA